MPRDCVVPGCTTASRKASDCRSLFSFPKNKDFAAKWERFVSRKGFQHTTESKVCEVHFEQDLIRREWVHVINGKEIRIPRKRPVLFADAVPTIFPNSPAYISRITAKKRNPMERKPLIPKQKSLLKPLVSKKNNSLLQDCELLNQKKCMKSETLERITPKNKTALYRLLRHSKPAEEPQNQQVPRIPAVPVSSNDEILRCRKTPKKREILEGGPTIARKKSASKQIPKDNEAGVQNREAVICEPSIWTGPAEDDVDPMKTPKKTFDTKQASIEVKIEDYDPEYEQAPVVTISTNDPSTPLLANDARSVTISTNDPSLPQLANDARSCTISTNDPSIPLLANDARSCTISTNDPSLPLLANDARSCTISTNDPSIPLLTNDARSVTVVLQRYYKARSQLGAAQRKLGVLDREVKMLRKTNADLIREVEQWKEKSRIMQLRFDEINS